MRLALALSFLVSIFPGHGESSKQNLGVEGGYGKPRQEPEPSEECSVQEDEGTNAEISYLAHALTRVPSNEPHTASNGRVTIGTERIFLHPRSEPGLVTVITRLSADR